MPNAHNNTNKYCFFNFFQLKIARSFVMYDENVQKETGLIDQPESMTQNEKLWFKKDSLTF